MKKGLTALLLALIVLGVVGQAYLFPQFPKEPPALTLTVGDQTVTLTAKPPITWPDRVADGVAPWSAEAREAMPVLKTGACAMKFRQAPSWVHVYAYDESKWDAESPSPAGVSCDLDAFVPVGGRCVYDIEAHWTSKNKYGEAHYWVCLED